MHPPTFPVRTPDPGPVAAWVGVAVSMAILVYVAMVEVRECHRLRVGLEQQRAMEDNYYAR